MFLLYKGPPRKCSAGKMEEKGQLMGVPIKLVMTLSSFRTFARVGVTEDESV